MIRPLHKLCSPIPGQELNFLLCVTVLFMFLELQEARREPFGPEQLAGGVRQASGGELHDHRHIKRPCSS